MSWKIASRLFVTLLLLFGSAWMTTSAIANEQGITILDVLSDREIEDLDIEIPEETPPGYHELIVDVYEEGNVVVSKRVAFCKDTDGFINWNNQCPGLAGDQENSEVITVSVDAKQLSDKSDSLVALFAVLLVSLFGMIALRGTKSASLDLVSTSRSPLAKSVAASSMKWGSLSRALARVLVDGSPIRSTLGYASLIPHIAVAGLVVMAVQQRDSGVILLSSLVTMVVILVSSVDALAGLYGAVIYLGSLAVMGDLSSARDWFSALLFALLLFAPRLFATALFTFSLEDLRLGKRSTRSAFASALLAGVIALAIVEFLPYLSGSGRELEMDSFSIAVVTALATLSRYRFDEMALSQSQAEGILEPRSSHFGAIIDGIIAIAFFAGLTILVFSGTNLVWPVIAGLVLLSLLGARKQGFVENQSPTA